MLEKLPIKPLNSVENAFAFILGVLFNQQVRATYAWRSPHMLGSRIGGLVPESILKIGEEEFRIAFSQSPAIHPFSTIMAGNAFLAAGIVVEKYAGDARRIWTPSVPANEFITRLTAFPGIGEHKARTALFVATVQLGIKVSDDGGNYDISDCVKLVQMFFPESKPILITQ